MPLSMLDQADLIRSVLNVRDECDRILTILQPNTAEDAPCTHPPEAIVDESTMGEDLYRCKKCGATSDKPFHSQG